MKYRVGFVTNSSSTSFVCDICGREFEGWDWDIKAAGFAHCENGHHFCLNHLNDNIRKKIRNKVFTDYIYLDSAYCPICNNLTLNISVDEYKEFLKWKEQFKK